MAREEEKEQESDGREAGENETKDKLSVLAFIPSLPRLPPLLIVSSKYWPHHGQGHGVARGLGEGGRGELRRRGGDMDIANNALP